MNGESAKTARLDPRLPQTVLDLIKSATDLQGALNRQILTAPDATSTGDTVVKNA